MQFPNVFPNTIKNLKNSIQISVLAHGNLFCCFKMDLLLVQTYSSKATLLLFCLCISDPILSVLHSPSAITMYKE